MIRVNFTKFLRTSFIIITMVFLLLSPIYAQQLPDDAKIDSDINVGVAPLFIKFELKGLWAWYQKWDFGDGTEVVENHPTHVYTKPGSYTIKVYFRGPDGEFQIQHENFITVYEPNGLCKLVVVDACSTRLGQPWEHAVDGDTYNEDGTASPNELPSYAIFRFIDSDQKRIRKLRVLADPQIARKSKMMKEFRVLLSNTGTEDTDFVTIWQETVTGSEWLEKEIEPTEAKYIKFIIDEPAREKFRYLAEFQVYSEFNLVDSLLSTITVTSPHVADGVEPAKIVINLRNQSNEPVSGKTENDFVFYADGDSNRFSNFCEIPNSGEYHADLTSLSPGDKYVTAFVAGIPVQYIAAQSKVKAAVLFTEPKAEKSRFIIVDSSKTRPNEGWCNAFDGDINDSNGIWNGSVGCIELPSFVIVEFSDQSIHWINKMRLLVDTKRDFRVHWTEHFQLLVSTSGIENDDFTQIISADRKRGKWHEIMFPAVPARYIKFVIDEPTIRWRQIGELEIYSVPEPTPVELAAFTAIHANGKIHLEWSTASESQNYGFEIERQLENSAFEKIGFVPGAGTTTETQYYNFDDPDINEEGTYYYRLKQIDTNGAFVYAGTAKVNVGVPSGYGITQNYPNPFNPRTIIRYRIPETGLTTLTVLNTLGQEIKQLVNSELRPGKYEAEWDGTNSNGKPVAAGMYFYRIQSNDFISIKRMILLK